MSGDFVELARQAQARHDMHVRRLSREIAILRERLSEVEGRLWELNNSAKVATAEARAHELEAEVKLAVLQESFTWPTEEEFFAGMAETRAQSDARGADAVFEDARESYFMELICRVENQSLEAPPLVVEELPSNSNSRSDPFENNFPSKP